MDVNTLSLKTAFKKMVSKVTRFDAFGGNLNNPAQAISISEMKEAITAANVSALKTRFHDLESRIIVLEKEAHGEQVKRNKLILRELVKDVRSRILDVNGLPQPTAKQSWRYCLGNLTEKQLIQANVPVKLWPKIKEILCPSSTKLNAWVYGYSPWDTAAVIKGMDQQIQPTWKELFKLVNKGKPVEQFYRERDDSIVEDYSDFSDML